MKADRKSKTEGASVRSASEKLVHDGRNYRLELNGSGTWRLRSRSRSHAVDRGLGTCHLPTARRVAREILEGTRHKTQRGEATLDDVVKHYLDGLPRRAAEATAAENVGALRRVVRLAWGRELGEVTLSSLTSQLWLDYMRKRQGRLDMSTRKAGNNAINSALRQAASVLAPRLRAAYRLGGFELPDCPVQWLPVTIRPKAAVDDAPLLDAWQGLRGAQPDMWRVIGLARFAGLRLSEIRALRGSWVVGGFVEMQDREEDEYWTKTGRIYRAPILNAELAHDLALLPAGELAVVRADNWWVRAPQAWVRPFVGATLRPLHRLRGLYADHLAGIERDAVAARLAGIHAAKEALGHTSAAVTEKHYLSTL